MGYTTRKTDPFFYGNHSIVEYEIDFSSSVTFVNLVDLTRIELVRAAVTDGPRPTYTAFIAKAVARAIEEFPFVNRRFYRPFGLFPRRFQTFDTVDIAVASETHIPNLEYVAFIDIVRSAEKQSLADISRWLHNLRTHTDDIPQWREFRAVMTRFPRPVARWLIRLPVFFPRLWQRYRGGAVLISSPAKYGVDTVIAAWTAPVGISYGLVKERAFVEGGAISARPSFHLTLNFDRRLMAGAAAARFFHRLVEILEAWPVTP
jgi:pyruvate/2-oxoglutarate dehydrogenase complex dihydrolipoamide acyltransferase (E2) component